jgi:hypothetical protein
LLIHSFNLNEDKFDIVVWSKDENVLAFYEFKYGEVFDLVVIFLKEDFCYRIDLRKVLKLDELLFFIEKNNENEISNEYSFLGKSNLIKDLPKKGFFRGEVWHSL